MIHAPVTAGLLAIFIWLIGFVWGSFVFMMPGLHSSAAIPWVSSNPWISVPILLAWPPITYFTARGYLRDSIDPRRDGFRLGVILAGANVLLDTLVVVIAFAAGPSYFASLSVLLGYALLLAIPWFVGAHQDTGHHARI